MAAEMPDAPVKKTIVVKTNVERAFRVFTAGIDTWWPRDHHIGKSPMKKIVVENFQGGRCYSEQVDGTDCDWGKVLVWEPPRRLVLAWQINVDWKYEPDLASIDRGGGVLLSGARRHDARRTRAQAFRATWKRSGRREGALHARARLGRNHAALRCAGRAAAVRSGEGFP